MFGEIFQFYILCILNIMGRLKMAILIYVVSHYVQFICCNVADYPWGK